MHKKIINNLKPKDFLWAEKIRNKKNIKRYFRVTSEDYRV